jgi:hypothetical protein
VTSDLSELQRRTQENLIEFLRTDAKLAFTFRKMAKNTQDRGHRAKLLEDIRKAVIAIRHFGERITDPAIQVELNAEADRLDEFLSKNNSN